MNRLLRILELAGASTVNTTLQETGSLLADCQSDIPCHGSVRKLDTTDTGYRLRRSPRRWVARLPEVRHGFNCFPRSGSIK
jgi:hypothetical protein